MLVYFSAENFRSIHQTIELNLRAAPKLRRHSNHVRKLTKDNKLKTLKSAVLYGANASGKSNIIKAIKFAQNLIISPHSANQPIKNEPFLFTENTSNQSNFYFEFIVAQCHFGYGVEFNNERIIEESLYLFKGDTETCLYTRTTDENKETQITGAIIDSWPEESNEYLQEFKFVAKYTAPNRLFLTEVDEKALVEKLAKHNELIGFLHASYLFFNYQLIIIYPHTQYAGLMDLVDNQQANTILNGFDTSINSLGKTAVATSKFPDLLLKDVEQHLLTNEYYPFEYENKAYQAYYNKNKQLAIFHIYAHHQLSEDLKVKLELEQESDGTRRLIDLISVLDNSAESMPTTFVIDEFDRSLHPNLAKKYLELFLNSDNQNQLIVTTHQSELLDNQLLRRDEIWFVQKEWDQSTRLYSLNDYSTRFDKDIHKAYLEGKFGAVPVITDNFEQITNANPKAS